MGGLIAPRFAKLSLMYVNERQKASYHQVPDQKCGLLSAFLGFFMIKAYTILQLPKFLAKQKPPSPKYPAVRPLF